MTTMKTPISKTILLIIGLLSAGTIAFAQASDSTYKQPKPGLANFYVEGSVSYMGDEMKTTGSLHNVDGLTQFVGAGASIGWRIGTVVKIQLETGIYSASGSMEDYYGYGDTVKTDLTLTATPVLLSASFCVPLSGSGRAELRLTPTFGLYKMKLKRSNPNGSYSFTGSPVAAGFGIGYTYHISRMFYADLGLRVLFRGGMHDDNINASLGSGPAGGITLAVGYKF